MSEETKKPNSYTSEFKESGVKLAIESDQLIAPLCKFMKVSRSRYYYWLISPKTKREEEINNSLKN